jgi:peptide chain release factor 3
MSLKSEIAKRRTFGIVSHPDAGKTTLTEKLLLFGGAIQTAGAVKSNKIKKTATSDFMEIEKQRGISVSTSVMGFNYNNHKINILDTPGHEDFAEDTYRTLTAVDSVIIVIDAAKGVEKQTKKLMEVCRMRKTPVIVFINKMDRPAKDTFDLLDEIENLLKIGVKPLSWPIGDGDNFRGVYNIYEQKLLLFKAHEKVKEDNSIEFDKLDDSLLAEIISEASAVKLKDELDLINTVYPEFNIKEYRDAEIAPVFFGSALNNFGIRELLECFVDIAPPPLPSKAEERIVNPIEDAFSGFVFKIHANIDPRHRDRLAFVKICSGKFERNKNYFLVRQKKNMKFSSVAAFMAEKKSIVDYAYPGDIVGLHDTGNFKIGDSITEGEEIHFEGLPSFSPELFKYIVNRDPMKSKQLNKGVEQLMDEGVAQMFSGYDTGRKIIGTVGALQFEVIQYRLLHEYGAKCDYEPIKIYKTCWITSPDKAKIKDFVSRKHQNIAYDKEGRFVFLAESKYALDMAKDKYPEITFHFKSDF